VDAILRFERTIMKKNVLPGMIAGAMSLLPALSQTNGDSKPATNSAPNAWPFKLQTRRNGAIRFLDTSPISANARFRLRADQKRRRHEIKPPARLGDTVLFLLFEVGQR
jgi:hypothetical protein